MPSLMHSKLASFCGTVGQVPVLNPSYSSKGCTQEHRPEQDKACAGKEFTQQKYVRCVVTKAKEKCQEGLWEERMEGHKLSSRWADKEGTCEKVNLSKDPKKEQKRNDEGSHPQGASAIDIRNGKRRQG